MSSATSNTNSDSLSEELSPKLSSESIEQRAADYALILSGASGWHLAFKRFRLALGIGQKTIAKRMGLHPTALTKWERGRSQPSKETRERALVSIGWTPPPQPPPAEFPTE